MKKIVAGILAHVDSGKTTFSEAMLYLSGSIGKLGRVDHGNSFLDNFSLERSRGITIFSKLARLSWGESAVTLLDTPGHVDFSAETERTMQVLDYAVLVIDAGDGVRGHTETLWRLLERHGVPTFIFTNKMDLCERSREQVMEELPTRLSTMCVDFSGFPHGTAETSLPPELAEACAAADEQAIEEFFEHGTISMRTMQRLIAERSVFPVFFGSALKQEGVDELFDAISRLVEESAFPDEFGARVFKVSHDPSGARLTWMKVTGGALEVKQTIAETTETGMEAEKVDQIRRYAGEK